MRIVGKDMKKQTTWACICGATRQTIQEITGAVCPRCKRSMAKADEQPISWREL